MNFNNVLKSKYLYYAAVALMVINVLGYVSLGSIECVLVLGGAAYLANQFTKNRTVDIFIGLFVSNILFGCGRLKEGLVGSDTEGKLKSLVADTSTQKKACAVDCEHGCDETTGKCKVIKAKVTDANDKVVREAHAQVSKNNNAGKDATAKVKSESFFA
jgi:hypothetical protein